MAKDGASNGAINVETQPASNGASNGAPDGKIHLYGETQAIEATEAFKNFPIAYELSKLPFLSPRPVKIIVAGAGASALDLAHAVQTGILENVDLHILEKNQGLGGTWFENRYPG